MVFADSDHQRRLLIRGIGRVHFRAAIEQQRDRIGASHARRAHQRRLARRVRGVRVGAGVEQDAKHRRAAVGRRERHRRQAVPVRERRLRSRAEQQPRRRGIVHAHGPMQRRRAVRTRGIDVQFLREECTHGGGVPLHGRIGQPGIGKAQVGEGHREEKADAKTAARGFFTTLIRRCFAQGFQDPEQVRALYFLSKFGDRGSGQGSGIRDPGSRALDPGPRSPIPDPRSPIPDPCFPSYRDRRNVKTLR